MTALAAIIVSLIVRVASAPADITITYTVEQPEKYLGKELCLYVDDGVPQRISCWSYRGEKRSQAHLRGIPEGDYAIWATIAGESSAKVVLIVR